MPREVIITKDAKSDILAVWSYFAEKEGVEEADNLLTEVENIINSLTKFAERGHVPPELERVDEYNYREVHLVPYRIIYKIESRKVIIHCVLDGRRDMQSLLYDRLLNIR